MTNTEYVPSEQNQKEEAKRPEVFSASLNAFKELFEKQENLEERLKMTIEFMRESLSQKGTPRFKDFWEAKKMCLPLFKEKINPILKTQLWTEYTELSSEAKRLKDLLEEQSTFAIEQIELALKAFEDELNEESTFLEKIPSIEFSKEIVLSKDRRVFYDQKQRQVQFYITLMERLKGLRKEVIETEMRIRHKNRLLKKLSSIGDVFLPKKKINIKVISEAFIQDVKCFVEEHFEQESQKIKSGVPLYQLREAIKGFQDTAKKLSLNSHAFSETRLELTRCWEIVKIADKEKKKDFLDKKELFKENFEKGVSFIEAFSQKVKENPVATKEEVLSLSKELVNELEQLELLHADVKVLKLKLKEAQASALEPFAEKEKVYLAKRQEQEVSRQEQLESFKQELQQVLRKPSSYTLKAIKELYDSFDEKKKALKVSEKESYKLDEVKKELYEVLLLKKEKEIQEEDVESIQELLQDWEVFKEQTRMRVESYRKSMGNSGFDFEKAMMFREQIDFEKGRLDRAVQKVVELEDRLG